MLLYFKSDIIPEIGRMKKLSFSLLFIANLALVIPVYTENDIERVPVALFARSAFYKAPVKVWMMSIINNSFKHSVDPKIRETLEIRLQLLTRIEMSKIYQRWSDWSITFWMYTRKEPMRREIIFEDLQSINSSTFDPNNRIIFLIHGWLNDETSDMIQMIKNAYLMKADFNIIVVDWAKYANSINYYNSRERIGTVAKVLTRFIEFMIKNVNAKTNQMQIVGHSLGAHIAGITGKSFTINKIGVIVGLDPAFPLFDIKIPNERLDITDAEYVVVIHTAAGILGYDNPLGHADFYVNYGTIQPGCGADLTFTCAHSRAYVYFAESILTNVGFWSQQCKSVYNLIMKKNCLTTGAIAKMGGLTITRAEGTYHVETNANSPYAKGIDNTNMYCQKEMSERSDL